MLIKRKLKQGVFTRHDSSNLYTDMIDYFTLVVNTHFY